MRGSAQLRALACSSLDIGNTQQQHSAANCNGGRTLTRTVREQVRESIEVRVACFYTDQVSAATSDTASPLTRRVMCSVVMETCHAHQLKTGISRSHSRPLAPTRPQS